jgi:smad nuclear-interacting protein 1
MPTKSWRLFIFKGDQDLGFVAIDKQTAYLIGRDRKVADLPIDHGSCSSQHAAIQHRSVPLIDSDGIVVPGKTVVKYVAQHHEIG